MDIPYWIDDPLFAPVRKDHRLTMDPAGPRLYIGMCGCTDMITPAWGASAVHEAYDQHLAVVQHQLRHPRGPADAL